jgi:hypothetical protein
MHLNSDVKSRKNFRYLSLVAIFKVRILSFPIGNAHHTRPCAIRVIVTVTTHRVSLFNYISNDNV